MIYNKTLKWVEPYGGWKNEDTGLCNRLLHWEVAYEINKENNFEYEIMLQQRYWPELGLIYLPNTSFVKNIESESIETEKTRFIYGYHHGENVKPFDYEQLSKMFRTGKLKLDNQHYYSNFGFKLIKDFYGDSKLFGERPLKNIRLRHNFMEDYLRRNTKDVVGIHIRRGVGIRYTEDDINSLPESVRDRYRAYQIFNKNSETIPAKYNFIQDKIYFNIIDKMLEYNPNQKFYISCDLPYDLFSYYEKTYGKSIITKNDFLATINQYLLNSDISVENLKYGNVIPNVVDLFSLSYCKLLIKSNNSTFSEFAENYFGQPAVNATDDWYDVIVHTYLDIKWEQPGDYNFNQDLDFKKLNKNLNVDVDTEKEKVEKLIPKFEDDTPDKDKLKFMSFYKDIKK
jgi:hypothetical protein